MKRGLLLVVLFSFLGMVTYAQKKAPAKKKTTASKTAASKTKKPVAKQQVKAKPDSSKNSTNYPKVTQVQLADTSKKGVPANFTPPLDGYYVQTAISTARPTPYAAIREADAVFRKRIWREIDVRERMNQYMVAPQGRLMDALMDAINNGELTAYDASPNPAADDPNGDKFLRPLTAAQAKSKLVDSTVVHKFDKNGNDTASVRMANDFNPDSILRFRIKEDWIFDKQRSVLEPRIIGIAPLVRPKAAGTLLDFQPAFWIYFPEARKILATKAIVMRHNDASNISYDQAFLKRIFSSYIVKESNEKDERIKDYMVGIDQLREAERIKKNLMDWELNLWQY